MITVPCVQKFNTDGRLDCSNFSLTNIPINIPSSVTHMVLSYNRIRKLGGGSFARFRNLIYLDISNNLLEKLEVKSFYGLNRLEILNISSNHLSNKDSFPKGVFKALSWSLIELDIRHNLRLSDYAGEALQDLTALEILKLDCISGKNYFTMFLIYK